MLVLALRYTAHPEVGTVLSFLLDKDYIKFRGQITLLFGLSSYYLFFGRFVHFGEKVKCHCEAVNCQGYLGSQIKNPIQSILATVAPQVQLREYSPMHHEAPRLKPINHLLPWTNCIEVSFNLRSKRKIDRLCWARKKKRTSLVPSSTSMPASPSEVPAADF